MKTTKLLVLSFLMLLSTSNLLAQPKGVSVPIVSSMQGTIVNEYKFGTYSKNSNYQNPTKKIKSYKSDPLEVTDSIIATNLDNSKKKYTYNYNKFGGWVSCLIESWDGSVWVNFQKQTYDYDLNNHLTTKFVENWQDSTWVEYYKDSHSYDSFGNRVFSLWQIWDGTNWVNYWQYTYTYDSNNNWITLHFEHWSDSIWVNYRKDTLTYDSNNYRISYLSKKWTDSNWLYNTRKTYTNYLNRNWESYLYEKWVDNNWANNYQYFYDYDSYGNKISELSEKWNGSNWIKYMRNTYTYNLNDNLDGFLAEYSNGNSWISVNGNLWHFDSFGNNIDIDCAQAEVFFKTITNVDGQEVGMDKFKLSQNYPNPLNPSTTISYTLSQSGFVQLKVYDMLGREVVKLVNKEQTMRNYKVKFNAKNLSSGVYLYRLQSSNFTETKKLILLP